MSNTEHTREKWEMTRTFQLENLNGRDMALDVLILHLALKKNCQSADWIQLAR